MVRIPDPAGGSYCIDSTEVTRAQYVTYLANNPPTTGQIPACSWNDDLEPNNWNPSTADDRPVAGVDWCDAYAFCAWAGKRLCGKIGGGSVDPASSDDPSASQWFNACSRGGTREYAYGDKWTAGACGWSGDDVQSHPCCVGGYPGVYDLSGGVEEWVDSCDGSTDENDGCLTHGPSNCDNTDVDDRDQDSSNVGFRCCAP
jgi:formylglycine-generating enzyme required for sulfatase activity